MFMTLPIKFMLRKYFLHNHVNRIIFFVNLMFCFISHSHGSETVKKKKENKVNLWKETINMTNK